MYNDTIKCTNGFHSKSYIISLCFFFYFITIDGRISEQSEQGENKQLFCRCSYVFQSSSKSQLFEVRFDSNGIYSFIIAVGILLSSCKCIVMWDLKIQFHGCYFERDDYIDFKCLHYATTLVRYNCMLNQINISFFSIELPIVTYQDIFIQQLNR